MFMDAFDLFSISCVINEKFIALHGGLSPHLLKLDDIKTGTADTTGSKTEKNFGKTVNVKRNQ